MLRVGDTDQPSINIECVYNPELGNASWTWIDPLTNESREDLPTCQSKCKLDPLTRTDLSRNWTGLVII